MYYINAAIVNAPVYTYVMSYGTYSKTKNVIGILLYILSFYFI